MSGLKGALDDAYTHAEALKTSLGEAMGDDDAGLRTLGEVDHLFHAADDLASRINSLSNQLRET